MRYKIDNGVITKTNSIYFSCEDQTDYITTVRLNNYKLTELYKVRKNRYKGFEHIKKIPHLETSVYQSWSIIDKKYTNIYFVPKLEFYETLIQNQDLKKHCRFILRTDRKQKIDQLYVEYRGTDYDILYSIIEPKLIGDFVSTIEKPHYLIFYCNEQSNYKAHGFLAGYYGKFENGHYEVGLNKTISHELKQLLKKR